MDLHPLGGRTKTNVSRYIQETDLLATNMGHIVSKQTKYGITRALRKHSQQNHIHSRLFIYNC